MSLPEKAARLLQIKSANFIRSRSDLPEITLRSETAIKHCNIFKYFHIPLQTSVSPCREGPGLVHVSYPTCPPVWYVGQEATQEIGLL